MYGVLSQIEGYLSLQNAWLPPIFFLDTKTTYFYLVSPIVLSRAKTSLY